MPTIVWTGSHALGLRENVQQILSMRLYRAIVVYLRQCKDDWPGAISGQYSPKHQRAYNYPLFHLCRTILPGTTSIGHGRLCASLGQCFFR